MRNGEEDLTTGKNFGGFMSHDVAVSKVRVTIVKVGQTPPDHISSAVAGRMPSTNGQLQLTQLMTICNALTLAGLQSGVDGP